MSLNALREKSIVLRIVLAFVLAGAALSLFLLHVPRRVRETRSSPRSLEELRSLLPRLDHEIDTLIASYGLEARWIRKRSELGSDSSLAKIERRIVVPLDVVPVRVNAAISRIARRYSAATVATENTRDNTVTIRVTLDGTTYQTIVLKVVTGLKRSLPPPDGGKTAT
jgi:hypothetical protein